MFKKPIELTKLDLNTCVQIRGYEPDPTKGRLYVFEAKKLYVAKVVGTPNHTGVRVGVAVATVPHTHPMHEALGDYVILIDHSLAKKGRGLFPNKNILALLEAQNAQVFGPVYQATNNIDPGTGVYVEDSDSRVDALANGGTPYGYSAARKGINMHNRLIDKSMKPIVRELHKTYKASQKTAGKHNPPSPKGRVEADPFSDIDIIEGVVMEDPAAG